MIKYISNREIYDEVVLDKVPQAESFLWIATADIKDMYVEKMRRSVPFLEVLSDLVVKGVQIRLIHAKEPGPRFREDFDKYPDLIDGLERVLCPRVHFKSVIVDGNFAYSGSANLTGAGLGAKSKKRRNFEAGFITDDQEHLSPIMEQFDSVWMGSECDSCDRKQYCADYKEM